METYSSKLFLKVALCFGFEMQICSDNCVQFKLEGKEIHVVSPTEQPDLWKQELSSFPLKSSFRECCTLTYKNNLKVLNVENLRTVPVTVTNSASLFP